MLHITLKLGSNISRDTVISKLVDLGYDRVSMVIEPGTFSVKGSVVDCFPVNQNQPVRCDFFGDEMDRLGSFRVDTQRTLSELKQTKILSVDVSNVRRLEYDTRLLDSQVMSNINVGDYIVHERVGIGQFAGFCRLTVGDKEGEYVRLHFKGTDKLFMPLDQIPLIHRLTLI